MHNNTDNKNDHEIILDNISFAYKQRNVLENVDLVIN